DRFYNMTGYRPVGSLAVPIPYGANITNIGFPDVDCHSGEPFVGTDWTPTVAQNSITWACETMAQNPNANALRWGTLYNFRFDSSAPPSASKATVSFFKTGSPVTVDVMAPFKSDVTPTPSPSATSTATPTPTATATATETPRLTPSPRVRPTPAPRP